MKVKTLSALAGVGAAMIMSSGAQAAPQLRLLTTNTTTAFLVNNNLQSATVGFLASDFGAGELLQGMIGNAANPWTITCSSGTFFNVDSDTGASFDGSLQTAATSAVPNGQFDTGVLGGASSQLGGITGPAGSNPIGFAQFGVGANSGPMTPVSFLSLNPSGVSPNLVVFRLTWARSASANLSMVIVTNTGGGNGFEYATSLTIPAVPAPGALALLGVAGLVGGARRRRA